jgi:hypothetical protein
MTGALAISTAGPLQGLPNMKAGIFFTGSGPILALTSYDSFLEPSLVQNLWSKGIHKFIAYEVPLDWVELVYGAHYDAVLKDVKQNDDLRVVDSDGHHVFYNFSFAGFGAPVYYEAEPIAAF